MYKQKEGQRRSLKRIFFHGLILAQSSFMGPVGSYYFASVDSSIQLEPIEHRSD